MIMEPSKKALKVSGYFLLIIVILSIVGTIITQDSLFSGIGGNLAWLGAGLPWNLLITYRSTYNFLEYPLYYGGPIINALIIYLIVWIIQKRKKTL